MCLSSPPSRANPSRVVAVVTGRGNKAVDMVASKTAATEDFGSMASVSEAAMVAVVVAVAVIGNPAVVVVAVALRVDVNNIPHSRLLPVTRRCSAICRTLPALPILWRSTLSRSVFLRGPASRFG